MQHRLSSSHQGRVFRANNQVVALLPQSLDDVRTDARFDQNIAADLTASHGKARRFQRSLNIHSIVDKVRDKLRVRQRLVGPSHDAKTDMHVTALHERRNNRMEWALAGLESIGVRGIE